MEKLQISSLNELRKKAIKNLDWFWQEVEKDVGIVWDKPYTKILDTSKGIPWSKWFVDGKTNIYKSSVEKFSKERPEKIAYYFVSEDGKTSEITYFELDQKVCKLANALKHLGVKKGDVVALYLPMIEEAIIAILASAKLGAIQTVIFSGYSAESLQIRLQDCKAKILFVTDGFFRKGKPVSHKKAVEMALKDTALEKIIIISYKKVDFYEASSKIFFYKEITELQSPNCETEITDSEDPLFILYTSGTTGKPKGVIQVHGGFSVFAGHQSSYLIDTQKKDIIFWPADIGWITGLVWNVYGLLMIGASAVIYDGALDYPNSKITWRILQDYNVTIFGISPTAVRAFRKNQFTPINDYDLSKLKNIPTTGEPMDKESWFWLFEKVGNSKIPIMNLSGGTEVGGAFLSVLPGMKLNPSTVGTPCPGIDVDIFDEQGNTVSQKNGYLVVKKPWPAMTRSLLNDDERYLKSYWSRFQNIWFHGDYVYSDEYGLWYMQGRVDDVINVSGHRMSTAEIEQSLISHEEISDAASIAIPDDITGEAIVVFFVAKNNSLLQESEISEYISEKIGKIARPKYVFKMSDLPKTRTGKIVRRLLKAKLLSQPLGDLSSIENPDILNEIHNLR